MKRTQKLPIDWIEERAGQLIMLDIVNNSKIRTKFEANNNFDVSTLQSMFPEYKKKIKEALLEHLQVGEDDLVQEVAEMRSMCNILISAESTYQLFFNQMCDILPKNMQQLLVDVIAEDMRIRNTFTDIVSMIFDKVNSINNKKENENAQNKFYP